MPNKAVACTETCAICQSELGSSGGRLALQCGHFFCQYCILQWRLRSKRCPVCRETDDRPNSVLARTLRKELLMEELVRNGGNVMNLFAEVLKENFGDTAKADSVVIRQLVPLLQGLGHCNGLASPVKGRSKEQRPSSSIEAEGQAGSSQHAGSDDQGSHRQRVALQQAFLSGGPGSPHPPQRLPSRQSRRREAAARIGHSLDSRSDTHADSVGESPSRSGAALLADADRENSNGSSQGLAEASIPLSRSAPVGAACNEEGGNADGREAEAQSRLAPELAAGDGLDGGSKGEQTLPVPGSISSLRIGKPSRATNLSTARDAGSPRLDSRASGAELHNEDDRLGQAGSENPSVVHGSGNASDKAGGCSGLPHPTLGKRGESKQQEEGELANSSAAASDGLGHSLPPSVPQEAAEASDQSHALPAKGAAQSGGEVTEAAEDQPCSSITPTKHRRHRRKAHKQSLSETARTSRDFQRSTGSQLLSQRERVLASTVADVEGLVHDVLVRWSAVTPADVRDEETFEMLQDRVEELFTEASVLESVRQNTAPHPFAVVEDILARLTILNNELDHHLGPPPAHARRHSDALAAYAQLAAANSRTPTSGKSAAQQESSFKAARNSPTRAGSQAACAEARGAYSTSVPCDCEGSCLDDGHIVAVPQGRHTASGSGDARAAAGDGSPTQRRPPRNGKRAVQAGNAHAGPAISVAGEEADARVAVDAALQELCAVAAPQAAGQMHLAERPGTSGANLDGYPRPIRTRSGKARDADQVLDDVGDLLAKHWYALGPRARQMADLALVLSRLAVMNETPAASSSATAGADERYAFQDVS